MLVTEGGSIVRSRSDGDRRSPSPPPEGGTLVLCSALNEGEARGLLKLAQARRWIGDAAVGKECLLLCCSWHVAHAWRLTEPCRLPPAIPPRRSAARGARCATTAGCTTACATAAPSAPPITCSPTGGRCLRRWPAAGRASRARKAERAAASVQRGHGRAQADSQAPAAVSVDAPLLAATFLSRTLSVPLLSSTLSRGSLVNPFIAVRGSTPVTRAPAGPSKPGSEHQSKGGRGAVGAAADGRWVSCWVSLDADDKGAADGQPTGGAGGPSRP